MHSTNAMLDALIHATDPLTRNVAESSSKTDRRAALARFGEALVGYLGRGSAAAFKSSPRGYLLQLPDDNGRVVTLCSPRDPFAEAARFLESRLNPTRRGPIVLLGVGAGHRLVQARHLAPEREVVGVVVCRGAFLAGLESGVLDGVLDDPRVRIVPGNASGLAQLGEAMKSNDGDVIVHEAAVRVADEDAAEAARLARHLLTYADAPPMAAERIRLNAMANREPLRKDWSLATWRGALAGDPVLVVGAGPSLDAALPIIELHGKRAWIIAVDAALRPMQAAGIVPDFAVSIDPNDANAEQCRDLNILPRLIYFPSTHPEVVARWQGERIAAAPEGDPLSDEVDPEGRLARLRSGGIVGTAALAAAEYMAAGAIAMVGMDLAFPDQRTHAAGAHHFRRLDGDPYLKFVPSWNGDRVPTGPVFERAIAWFELFARSHEGTLIDTCRDGARKEGFVFQTLGRFLRERPDLDKTLPQRRVGV
ncbi:DUF115 domain-containing protein [bacterium]|nr:DUF115 domain-containing protein [bacterium]